MTNEEILAEIDKIDQRFKYFVKAINKCENIKELKIVNDMIVHANNIDDLDSMTYSILVLALNAKRCELGETALFAVPLNECDNKV
jgi:hypothetical protein